MEIKFETDENIYLYLRGCPSDKCQDTLPIKPILTLEERRARRAERREKQREENIGRAKKMHAARVEFEKEKGAPKIIQYQPPEFNIGCSGWYYWHWHKLFYPETLPAMNGFRIM